MQSNLIYLTQTDTTVGFLSSDDKKLTKIKQRDNNKKILQVVDSFKTLQKYTRVPNKYKKMVRNSKKTTFIYPNNRAFRVIPKDSFHHRFVSKFKILYSTSANKTNCDFDFDFAFSRCDIALFNQHKFKQTNSSKIFRLYKNNYKKIR
jgi:tRNA A37 threonylcarbamoyladenosine synthetase subunit TsaC/SUA5/YrdC